MQTESEREGKGLIQETRARIETLENIQGKARLRQLRGFRIAAKTRRVINAEQYWD